MKVGGGDATSADEAKGSTSKASKISSTSFKFASPPPAHSESLTWRSSFESPFDWSSVDKLFWVPSPVNPNENGKSDQPAVADLKLMECGGIPSPEMSRPGTPKRHRDLRVSIPPRSASLEISRSSPTWRKSLDGYASNNEPADGTSPPAEDIYKKDKLDTYRTLKGNKKKLMEWLAFLCMLGTLATSFTVEQLKNVGIWGLKIWKWCVLAMVVFSGMALVTKWIMHFIFFVIERNFLLKMKVWYVVHEMKKSVQVFMWLALVLVTWLTLFDRGIEQTKSSVKILHYVTRSLIAVLVGSFMWLLKTLLLKILASSFHANTFFNRIQESIFQQYVLKTLSGLSLAEEEAEMIRRPPSTSMPTKKGNKDGLQKKCIDMEKLLLMKEEKISARTMKDLLDEVAGSKLSTMINKLEYMALGEPEKKYKEITSEMEAINTASEVFCNVSEYGSGFICEGDLLRFMKKEQVELALLQFEVGSTRKIDNKALKAWVVKVYNDRKALVRTITDTKTVIKQLDVFLTSIVIILTILAWLLLVEFATTSLLVFISSQLVVAAFMFGNTTKNIFESIVFLFVTHPFDVGDRIVVDGVQLKVEEMNILTTVFLKLNNEKVYYPTSVLSTKIISNYFRSQDMGDVVEFSIDMIPLNKIRHLKERINAYFKDAEQHYWQASHQLMVTEIENANKIKMALYFNHTMNFQEFGEKNKRRAELVMELMRLFEELNVTFYLMPQVVHPNETKSEETNVA